MADIALLTGATGAEPIWPEKATIVSGVANEALTQGAATYMASTGKYGAARAGTAGKQQFRGIALQACGAAQGTSILQRGAIGGFDVSGLAYDALVYLSDTAGGLLSTTAGTMTVPVGRVVPMSDASLTKVIFIDVSLLAQWA